MDLAGHPLVHQRAILAKVLFDLLAVLNLGHVDRLGLIAVVARTFGGHTADSSGLHEPPPRPSGPALHLSLMQRGLPEPWHASLPLMLDHLELMERMFQILLAPPAMGPHRIDTCPSLVARIPLHGRASMIRWPLKGQQQPSQEANMSHEAVSGFRLRIRDF